MLSFVRYICLLSLSLFSVHLHGQFVNYGEEPFNTKWQQITTRHYQLIFPAYYADQAMQTASFLEASVDSVFNEVLSKPFTKKPFPLILHTASSEANAFVSWAPKRMEWYSMAPPNVEAYNWNRHLALHEQKHVAQFLQLRNNPLEVLFGEAGTAALFSLSPLWYYEGDAVVSESRLSNSGRGREADFQHHYYALEEKGQRYSYEKAMFGSYTDIVPDHYSLGYHLSSYVRTTKSNDAWKNTLHDLSNVHKVNFFGPTLRKHTSLSGDELYQHTFDSLQHYWNKKGFYASKTSYPEILPNSDEVEHQLFVQPLHADELIFQYKSYSTPTEIVRMNTVTKRTKTIVKLGTTHNLSYSFNGRNLLTWSEQVPDKRWNAKSYSVIRYHNLHTGITKTLEKNAFDFSPDLLPGSDSVAFVRIYPNGSQELHVRQISASKNKTIIQLGDTIHFQTPKWLSANTLLIVGVTNYSSILYYYSLKEHHFSKMYAIAAHKIQDVATDNGNSYFISDFEGISQVYQLKQGKLFRLTNSKYGTMGCYVSQGILYTSVYTLKGYRAVEINLSEIRQAEVKPEEQKAYPWVSNSPDPIHLPLVDSTYEVKKYSRIKNLINIHSWLPLPLTASPDVSLVDGNIYGFTLFSQNDLSTFISSVGVNYSDRFQYRTNLRYSGLYPVFQFSSISNYASREFGLSKTDYVPDRYNTHHTFSFATSLPLHWRYLNKLSGITPRISYRYSQDFVKAADESIYLGVHSLQYSISGYLYTRIANRNLGPKWGGVMRYVYIPGTLKRQDFGKVHTANYTQYLPGLLPDHSLSLGFGYEKQRTQRFLYSQYLAPTLGYERLALLEAKKATLTYSLPLMYPDGGIRKLVYFKRIHGNFIFDYSDNQVYQNNIRFNEQHQSITFELVSEMHLLRFPLPFLIGIKNIYLPQENRYAFSMSFNMVY